MNSSLFGALALIALVVVGALLLRRAGSGDPTVVMPPQEPGPDEDEPAAAPESDASDDADDWRKLAIESDGHVWVPDRHVVHRLALLGEAGEHLQADERVALGTLTRQEFEQMKALAGRRSAQTLPGEALHAADFNGARVRRGAPDLDPWRLEALGRDGEYVAWSFETEEAARLALEMLERLEIVRRPLDDDGRPVAASREDFEEARRRYEETERELANLPEAEDETER